MTPSYGLAALLDASVARNPDNVAVSVPEGQSLTYRELGELTDRMRDRLVHYGVQPGDRVGLRLHKSLDAVVALFGALKAGAAYVPVDVESPMPRGAFIHTDCAVRVVVTEAALVEPYGEELRKNGATPRIIGVDLKADGVPIRDALAALEAADPAPIAVTATVTEDSIAYLLYTSGSTGNPKGVVLTHGNALSFVDWCSEIFAPTSADVFSSHAPFHFDLSILDIYVPLKHGARLCLIGEALGKDPVKLAATIAAERITAWYSTPSILNFLALYGRIDRYDYSALRIVNFAGEVFPIPQFKAVRAIWTAPRYFNLYGPTETNVCTYYEVPQDDSWHGFDTFPIGGICVPNKGRVVEEDGRDVERGAPGELVVWGPNVMSGYWNLPENNAKAFLVAEDGTRWYHTGDIVTEAPNGEYKYLGRRDRMVKRRGYRVELGEIEAGLAKQEDVREVAVISVPDRESGVRITAFVSAHAGRTLGVLGLKRLSTQALPPYMIPDAFVVVDALPRTSTNKVDLQALKQRASGSAPA